MKVWELAKGVVGLQGLRQAERPEPVAKPGQVVVAVHAASLNYRDQAVLNGGYPGGQPKGDCIPLSDGAGEVVAVGEGVTRFKPGDKVAATFFQIDPNGPPSGPRAPLGAPLDGMLAEKVVLYEDGLVKLPEGYRVDWAGEYASQQRTQRRLMIVVPITILIILIILYTMFDSLKWASLMLANIAMAPLGGLLALLLTGTHFSVSSGVGFLALFGVSVQTGVIMLEYINQLRARGHSVIDAAVEGAILRLRPILMTTLVATLGLLPAATSHGIGSDSQRPFAIVIVGGLIVGMFINIFLLPTLYVWSAGERDVLPAADADFDETES